MINYLVYNTLTSTIHALVMFFLGILNVPQWLFLDGIKLSIAYNIYDMYIMPKSNIRNQMYLHHIILISLSSYAILNPTPNIMKLISLGYMTEITTPFLNIAWYFNAKKNRTELETKIFYGSSLITFLLYLPFRVILTTYISYLMMNYHSFIKYPVFAITGLNYFWYYKMCLKARKLFFKVDVKATDV